MESTRDQSLDGLRGFAALYVVFFHILSTRAEFSQYSEATRSLVLAGSDMVFVFFVLSGYYISESVRSLFISHTNPYRAFVARRFFRIMPLWFLLLTFMLFTKQISIDVYWGNLIFYFGNLEMVNNKWLPVIPAWTLQSEIIFYILTAFFLRKIASLKSKGAFLLWFICIAFAAAWRYIAIEHLLLSEQSAFLFFFNQMHYFAAGLVINKLKNWIDSIKLQNSPKGFWLLEICIVCLFLMNHHSYFSEISMVLLAPLLVFLVSFKQSILRQFFKNILLVRLGYASFSIYILQSQCFGSINYFYPNLSLVLQTLVILGFTIFAGLVAYYFLERPIIKWSKGF